MKRRRAGGEDAASGGPKPPVDGPRAVRVMQQQGAYAPRSPTRTFHAPPGSFLISFPQALQSLRACQGCGWAVWWTATIPSDIQKTKRKIDAPGRRDTSVFGGRGGFGQSRGALDSAHSRRSNGLG